MKGVIKIEGTPEQKTITVHYEAGQVSLEDIKKALAQIGYDVAD